MTPAPPSRARRVCGRLLLAAGATILTLAFLEVVLRIAPALMPGPRGGVDAPFRVLCVGDSHTYGLNLPPDAAYPARLQRLLDPAGTTIGVKNYGVPGRNSGALLRELPRYLDEIRPDVVIVLVGFNDAWNFDAAPEAGESFAARVRQFARELKLVRMARLVLFREQAAAPQMVVENGRTFVIENGERRPASIGGKAFGVLEGDALATRVESNVARIIALVRSRGARVVVLDYATEQDATFVTLNAALADVARREGATFCEVAVPMRDAIRELGKDALFFPDGHPTGVGYARVAEIVAARLREAGGLPAPTAASAPADAPADAPTLEIAQTGGRWIATVRGSPQRDVQIVLAATREPPIRFAGADVAIGKDALFDRSFGTPSLRARTDDSGIARIELPPELFAPEQGKDLFAVAALYPAASAALAPRVSPVVSFRP